MVGNNLKTITIPSEITESNTQKFVELNLIWARKPFRKRIFVFVFHSDNLEKQITQSYVEARNIIYFYEKKK